MKSYYDIVGDGGSKILEQVGAQQGRIEESLARVRHLVAIGSGKGGVGKSTLTWQIAALLRGRGREVAVLDADLNGPSQARLAGVRSVPLVPDGGRVALPRNAAGIGVVSLGGVVPETEAVDFESVAEGSSHVWRATREFSFLGQLVGAVDWGEQDLLLVDLPPGAERTFQYAQFLGAKAAFVLVTISSELSRGVVSRSVAALGKLHNRVPGYIENMSGYYCADCGKLQPLFPVSEAVELGLPCLGRVPFDPSLAEDCDRGIPIVDRPEGAAARALEEVADRLLEVMERDG